MHGRWAWLGLLVVIGAGGRAGALERGSLLEAASGGALTVHATGKAQLRWAPAGLDERVRAARLRGEAFFNTPFVAAPSAAHLRDGLGPLFNSASCESCHNNLGRGRPAAVPGSASVSLVVQLSARDAEGAWGAHPRYGAAFNPQGIAGVPPCAECHVPAWRTGPESDIPELADQLIHPFTDLLLHDMGPGLADGRPDRSATGSEWRTAPLWGIGSAGELGGQPSFLHDGRARTLEEAILWHGGEAEASRSAFVAWTRAERDALIAFLESL